MEGGRHDGVSRYADFPSRSRPSAAVEHLGGHQLLHAAMIERADALLARAALHLLLQVDGPRVVRLGPGDVRRPEQRHHRPVEGGGEVARPAVGGHQQVGPADARLGQAQRQRRPVGAPARPGRRARGRPGDAPARRSPGPASRSAGPHSTSTPQPRRSARSRARAAKYSAGQCLAEPNAAPGFRQITSRIVVASRPARQTRVRGGLVGRRREQLHACAGGRAAGALGEAGCRRR